jgi:hypothetical protein
MNPTYLDKMTDKELVAMLHDHIMAIDAAEKYTAMLLKEAANRILAMSTVLELKAKGK